MTTATMAKKTDNKEIRLDRVRRVGFSRRPQRVRRNLSVYAEYIRQQHPDLSEPDVEVAAQELFDELERTHPLARGEFEKTAPTSRCPERRGLMSLAEVAAMRTLPQVRAVEAELERYRGGTRKRNPALPRAILECHSWIKGVPEIRCCHEQLVVHRNLTLDWALGNPVGANGESARGESATYELLGSMLDRTDPQIAVALNIAAMRQLAKSHPKIGVYCSVDGTDVPAPAEQRQSFCKVEEMDLRRGMEARLLSHGEEKNWRGWVLLKINCIKSTLPLVWALLPLEHGREFMGVPLLLDRLFELWPDCPIEYLVGDKEYAVEELHRELEFRYAVHPVVPRRRNDGRGDDWFASGGTPTCAKHGLMTREPADGYFRVKHRLARGIPQGDLDPKSMRRARNRWRCDGAGCGVRATTYFDDNPTLYPFLPHQGAHPLVGRRVALQKRRNSSECVIGGVKRIGVALPGMAKAAWLSSRQRAEWLVGMTLAGQTWRRLAHESGAYQLAEAEAKRLGVVKGP